MSDQPVPQTILVKKSDGTTERITLDELKKRQQAKSAIVVTPAPISPQIINKEPIIPPKPDPIIAVPKPISKPPVLSPKPIFAQKSIPMRPEDAKSLLQEDAPVSATAQTKIVPTRLNQVDEIIKKLSFKVNPNLENRLRSLVQLRLKDIRGEDETKYLMLQAPKDGGLGFSQAQADEVVRFTVIPTSNTAIPTTSTVIPVKTGIQASDTLDSRFRGNDKDATPPTPTVIPAKAGIQGTGSIVDKIIGASPVKDNSIEDLLKPKSTFIQPIKNTAPVMSSNSLSDVRDMHPKEMGPIDELKYFTLTDFRRLAGNPNESAMRLKQKFVNLQLESFVLFLNGLEVWKQSPLYNDYVNEVEGALHTKRKVSAVLGEKNKINLAEISALIKMEQDLKY